MAGDARAEFQLGRAYTSAGQYENAAKAFVTAADARHPVAAGYAGDAYLFGRGVEKDFDKARKYYELAVAGGFEPAKAMLDAMTFDPSLYMIPMIEGLYQGIPALGDTTDLRKAPLVNAYVFSFSTSLNSSCSGALKPQVLRTLLETHYKGPVTPEIEGSGDYQIYATAGDYDAQTFVQRHACDGPVAEQMIENLSAYISMHK